MSRRVVARRNLTKKVRAWVRDFTGKDIVRGYRNQYHASWSCAIIELGMLGVSFPPEDIEDAKRRQIGAVISYRARKAKKAAAKRAREFPVQEWDEQYHEPVEKPITRYIQWQPVYMDDVGGSDDDEINFDLDSMEFGEVSDDYDPFADE